MKLYKQIFLLLLFYSVVNGQSRVFNVEKLSLENGISHNMVYSITQDSEKFLWFGTMFGLVRYDGTEFLKFRTNLNDSTTLSDDDIVTIFEGADSKLWIGTFGGGFNSLDLKTNQISRFTPENIGLNHWDGIVWSINQDFHKNIWIATNDSGLLKFNPSENSVDEFKNSDSLKLLPSNFIRAIKSDNDHLWIGGYGGLAELNSENGNFKIYSNPDIGNKLINDIEFYGNDTILCGTSKGFYTFSKADNKFSKVVITDDENEYINTLLVAEDDQIWLGSNNGVHVLDDFSPIYHINQANGLYSNNTVSLHEDHSGIIWVGSYLGGISKIITNPSRFEFIPIGTNETNNEDKFVKDLIFKSGHQIYALTAKNLFKLDNNHKPLRVLSNLDSIINDRKSLIMSSCVIDKYTRFFIGTNNGVLQFDKKLKFTRKINSENHNLTSEITTKLFIDSKNNLWIGTLNGIDRINLNNESTTNWKTNSGKHKIVGQSVLSIFEDHLGFMWVGTFRGLNIIDPYTGEVSFFAPSFTNTNSLMNKYLFDFYEPDSNTVWLATGNGISVYNREKEEFHSIKEKDGLPSGVIKSIIGLKEDIYISTNRGLSIYNKESKQFKNYDINDGLGNNIFAADASILAYDENIFLGGLNGITLIKTKGKFENKVKPENKIISVKVFGKDLSACELENLKLNYDQNSISITFAALEYTQPENNEFAYKLDGVDKDWVITKNNFVNYHLLPSNKYIFYVKSSNADGVWNDQSASFSFEVLPPFWKTAWFYILMGVLLFGAILLIHRSVMKRQLKIYLEIEEAKKEENEVVRKRAAEDFHDELGHLITRISLLVEVLKSKLKGIEKKEFEHLNRLSKLSSELSNKMRDFIWSLDSRNDSLYEVIVRLKDFGDELFYSTAVSFSVEGVNQELDNLKLSLDWRRHITLIFKEAMNNILKYSNCENVTLIVKRTGKHIIIELEDDGRGFDLKKINQGNGLRNMRTRAEYIKARLAIISNINKGTVIKFEGMLS